MTGATRLVGRVATAVARRRLRTMVRLASEPAPAQQRVLQAVMQRAARTEFGREYDLGRVRSVDDLQHALPLQDYASLAPWWDRARAGEPDVCWPGMIRYWAETSGTTSGEKYVPVSNEAITSTQRGGFDALVPHLADSGGDLFGGKLLFLGGSTALRREGKVWIGDATGIMARSVPWPATRWHAPDAEVRSITNWEEKVHRAAEQLCHQDLRMLSGIPSWIILFGEAVLAAARRLGRTAATLADVWPNLSLFVHGGVAFDPYRRRTDELIGKPIRYTDTYTASECGMLAVQDQRDDQGMLPVVDRGAVYEFVPADEVGKQRASRVGLHEVEPGVDYAVALTTDSGIFSYLVGDLVRFTSTNPRRLLFTGRTAHRLNAVGEQVSGGEIERALTAAAAATGADVEEYAVVSHFPDHDNPSARHEFLVEFRTPPADLAAFAMALDRDLQRGNEAYRVHRTYGLCDPVVGSVPAGTFMTWMRRKGKVGGQHKVPHVPSAEIAEELRGVAAELAG